MSIFTAMVNSVTGLKAQSFALENISDNIANSQTIGYKKVDTSFLDMVSDAPQNMQTGGSVTGYSRGMMDISGPVTTTAVSTNIAISGSGFIMVRQRVGNSLSTTTEYTRRGDFTLDKDGYFVNGAGKCLVTSSGTAITASAAVQSVSIGSDGAVTETTTNGSTSSLGTIGFARFNAPSMLKRGTGGAFLATDAAGTAQTTLGTSTFVAGSVEGSNTDIADEFSKMIVSQQAYSANTKVISTAQQLMQDTINMVR